MIMVGGTEVALRGYAKATIGTPGGDVVFWDSTAPGATGFAVEPEPPFVQGAAAGGTVTTATVQAVVTGGQAPLTYYWALTASNVGTWTATNPSGKTTAFRASGLTVGEPDLAEFTVTVTDAGGATATAIVAVTAINYGELGGY